MGKDGKIAVVVTTEYRGVFFGYVSVAEDLSQRTLRVENGRMCVYWPEENRGVVNLANRGPEGGSRITAPAPAITLQGVTAVMECSKSAAERWELGLWS